MDDLWPAAASELREMVEGGWYVTLWYRDVPGPKQYTFVAQVCGAPSMMTDDAVRGEGSTVAAAVLDLVERMREAYPDDEIGDAADEL